MPHSSLVVIMLATLIATVTTEARAQSAQAAIGAMRSSSEAYGEAVADLNAAVERAIAAYGAVTAYALEANNLTLLRLTETAVSEAHEVLKDEERVERWRAAHATLTAFLAGLALSNKEDSQRIKDLNASLGQGTTLLTAGIPTPAIFKAKPSVAFTVGLSWATAPGQDIRAAEIETNLLGAASGAVLKTVGSDALGNYLSSNVSLETSIPTSGASTLSAAVGLGLGELHIGSATIWPVVAMEQVDGSDTRVPADVRVEFPDEENWTSPVVGVSILSKGSAAKIKQSGLAPIFALGIRAPYFYPGSAFEGLGALFSDKRSDFMKEGRVQWIFSVALPLFPISAI